MASSVADLSIDVSTNTAAVETGFTRLSQTVNARAKEIEGAANGISAGIAGIGKAFVALTGGLSLGIIAHQMVEFGKQTIEAAENLNNLSAATGSSVESLSKLSNQAFVAGTSFSEFQGFLFKMNKSLAESKESSSDAARALQYLGVTATDPAKALQQVIDGLAKYEGGIGKAALATAIFGKSGQDFLATLDNMAKLGDVQATVTARQAEEAEQLNIAMRKFSVEATTFKDIVLNSVVPAMLEWINQYRTLREAGGAWYAFLNANTNTGNIAVEMQNLSARVVLLKDQILTLQATAQKDTRRAWLPGLQRDLDEAQRKLEAFIKLRDAAIFANVSKLGFTGDARDLALNQPKPSATFSLKDKSGPAKVDEFAKAMERFREQTAAADAQLTALLSGEKFTPMQKALEQLRASDVWKTFSAGQKQALEQMAAMGIATEKTIDLQTRLGTVVSEVGGDGGEFTKQWASQFGTLTEAFNAGLLTLDRYRELTQQLLNQQPFAKKDREELEKLIKLEQQAIEGMERMQQEATRALGAFADQNKRLEDENKLLGLGAEARARALVSLDAESTRITLRNAGDVEGLELLEDQVAQRQNLVTEAIRFNDEYNRTLDILHEVTDATADFLEDFAHNGTDAFRRVWDDFKRFAIRALTEIAAKQVVVGVTGAVGLTGAAGAAANTFAGGSGGLGGAANLVSNAASIYGSAAEVASAAAAGYTAAAAGAGAFSGVAASAGVIEAGSIAGGLVAGASTATAGGVGAGIVGGLSAGLAAIPVAGWVALAALIVYGIVQGSKEPSQVRGQLRIAPVATGFEDNAFSPSAFGNVGFNDSTTQYFGGGAAKFFDDMVAGALDAFATRFSPAQSAHFAEILNAMTFRALEGTYTTEDFLQIYGGDVLKKIIVAAFEELDPALASIAEKFEGTAQEIATFGNTLLAVYDASSRFSDEFRSTILEALDGATLETAGKVLAFAQIVASFGDSMTGLGAQFEAVAAESIPLVIDALGGVQNATAALGYVNQNFRTDAERVADVNTLLNNTFAELGVAIPHTHQEFLNLLSSLDLNTEAGRAAYAALIGVSNAFVFVHGTAQDAAAGVDGVSDALQRVTDAADYFNEHFYSDSERATQAATAGWQAVHDAWTQFGVELLAMGVDHIPTTRQAFRSLIEGIDTSTESGRRLYDGLIVLAPGIDAINAAVESLADTTANAGDVITETLYRIQSASDQAATFLDTVNSRVDAIASQSGGDKLDQLTARSLAFVTQIHRVQDDIANAMDAPNRGESLDFGRLATLQSSLAQLQPQYNAITADLARLVTLRAQYGDSVADQLFDLQNWYTEVANLFRTPEELTLLQTTFNTRWDAIVTGTAQGVDNTLDQLERLVAGMRDKMTTSAQKVTEATIKLASGFAALGRPIPQTHQAFLTLIDSIDITTASGAALINALSPLADAFITVHGSADDAAGSVGDLAGGLARAREQIGKYLDTLLIGDLSPLSPFEKFQQAQAQYASTLVAAQSGNVDALGNITGIADELLRLSREVFASGSQGTATFNKVVADLTALGNATTGASNPQAVVAGASQADIQRATDVLASMEEQLDETRRILAQIAANTGATADNTIPKPVAQVAVPR